MSLTTRQFIYGVTHGANVYNHNFYLLKQITSRTCLIVVYDIEQQILYTIDFSYIPHIQQ